MGTKNNVEFAVDRFTLEEAIAACFNVSDDLELMTTAVLENGTEPDKIANMLTAAAELHKLRCARAFDVLEQLIENGTIQ